MDTFTDVPGPRFALGVGEYSGSSLRHLLRRRPNHRRRTRPATTSESSPFTFSFTLNPSRWLLFPKDFVDPFLWSQFYAIPADSCALSAVNTRVDTMYVKSPFKTKEAFKFPIQHTNPFFVNVSSEMVTKARELIIKNQRLRWQMKRLIHSWRLARLKQINQEDPITMETPRTPVYIYDWTNKAKYVFEARSLFRDFRTKLGHHDELFVEPKEPRNPFTNQVLSMGQTHFILKALRDKGQTDWLLESYRSVQYNLDAFKKKFKHPLGLHALKCVFSNPTTDECVDLLYDYIYSEHEQHDATLRRQDVWIWFLRNRPQHPRIVAWRGWCYAYYRAWLTETQDRFTDIVEGIRTETAALVDQTMSEMIAIWRIYGAPKFSEQNMTQMISEL